MLRLMFVRWGMVCTVIFTIATTANLWGAGVEVDPAVKSYEKVSGISGNLNSVGSDTLNNLMTYWAEAFQKEYPNVKVQTKGEGSATAPPALTEGTAELGPMSREMKDTELEAFEKKHGFKPTRISVALIAWPVYVNKDNPIKGLTLQQVDGIFSTRRKRKCGDYEMGTSRPYRSMAGFAHQSLRAEFG